MPTQPLIVGNPVLVVVDIQQGGAMPVADVGIPHMPGHAERVERAEKLVAAARTAGIPVVFFQEVHRPSGVDFGRELDGTEGVHCVDGQPGTDLEPSLRPLPDEFHIVKRRYSGFIGTDFAHVIVALVRVGECVVHAHVGQAADQNQRRRTQPAQHDLEIRSDETRIAPLHDVKLIG